MAVSIFSPELQNGFKVSWKFSLNLCSQRFLKPSIVRIVIQCWLQVLLLTPGHQHLAQLFQTWHNTEPRGRANSGYPLASPTFFKIF